MYRIGKTFRFSAAHHLTRALPAGHKCLRPHGHDFSVEVTLVATELVPPGFVTDFGELKPLKAYIDEHVDHHDLNEVLGFDPTCEAIARFLFDWCVEHLEPTVPGRVHAVRVSESEGIWAEYLGEGR